MPLIYNPLSQILDGNGDPYSGTKMYVYDAGTTDLRTSYSDKALTTPNANPLIADSAGRFGPLYMAASTTDYKLKFDTSADVNIVTQDNIPVFPFSQGDVGLVLYPQSSAESAASVTPTDYAYPQGDPRRIASVSARLITINVPSDVATLQEAIDVFPVRIPDVITVINIETGHSLTAGIGVADGDYGHIRIDAEDYVTMRCDTDGSTAVITNISDTSDFAVNDKVFITKGFDGYGSSDGAGFTVQSKTSTTITIDANSDEAITGAYISKAITVDNSFTGHMFQIEHAVGPELNCLINLNDKGTGQGAEVNRAASWSVLQGGGCINAPSIGIQLRASRVVAASTFWGGADDVGIRMQQSATATFNASNVDYCLGSGSAGAVFVSRACSINILMASATKAGKGRDGLSSTANAYGIEVRRSIAAVTDSDFSGAVSHGVFARHTGLIGAREALANDCGGSGFRAEDASIIGAQGSSATGCRRGYSSQDVSILDCQYGDASGHGAWGIAVDNGGLVNARSCTTDNGTPGAADMKEAPNVMTAGGIIFVPGLANDVATGTYTIDADYPATEIDSSGGAVTGTLGSGPHIGFVKTIVMTDASNISTVSVTAHETSDPKVFTFVQVDDTLVLLWSGTEWITVATSGFAI